VKGHPPVDELLEFPCDYIFKAFGPNDAGGLFASAVRAAVATVVPVALDAIKSRPSSNGAYLCVTLVVRLYNSTQLHAIYAALQGVPDLKYLL